MARTLSADIEAAEFTGRIASAMSFPLFMESPNACSSGKHTGITIFPMSSLALCHKHNKQTS
jgi:hypothetical protein